MNSRLLMNKVLEKTDRLKASPFNLDHKNDISSNKFDEFLESLFPVKKDIFIDHKSLTQSQCLENLESAVSLLQAAHKAIKESKIFLESTANYLSKVYSKCIREGNNKALYFKIDRLSKNYLLKIEHLANSTNFRGRQLLNGTSAISFNNDLNQLVDNSFKVPFLKKNGDVDYKSIDLSSLKLKSLGLNKDNLRGFKNLSEVTITDIFSLEDALSLVNKALKQLNKMDTYIVSQKANFEQKAIISLKAFCDNARSTKTVKKSSLQVAAYA